MEPKKMSRAALAVASGITYPTLLKYCQRGFKGTTPEEVQAYRDEHVGYGRKSVREREDEDDEEPNDLDRQEQLAKIEAKQEEARHRRIQNDILEGETGYRAAFEQGASELVNLIRARLELIPDECSAEAPAEFRIQERERLADKIHLILTEMSQWKLTTEE